jgi:hypothetical protein
MSALPELEPVGGSALAVGAVTSAAMMRAAPATDTAALFPTRIPAPCLWTEQHANRDPSNLRSQYFSWLFDLGVGLFGVANARSDKELGAQPMARLHRLLLELSSWWAKKFRPPYRHAS